MTHPFIHLRSQSSYSLSESTLKINKLPSFKKWINLKNKIEKITKIVINIGLVGKYVELPDSYFSVLEALKHAGWYLGVNVKVHWINARINKICKCLYGVIITKCTISSFSESFTNTYSMIRHDKY